MSCDVATVPSHSEWHTCEPHPAAGSAETTEPCVTYSTSPPIDARLPVFEARFEIQVGVHVVAPQPPAGRADTIICVVLTLTVAKMLVGVAASGKASWEPTGATHSTAWLAPSMTTTTPSARPTATSPLLSATGAPTTCPPTSRLQAGFGGQRCGNAQGISGYAATT